MFGLFGSKAKKSFNKSAKPVLSSFYAACRAANSRTPDKDAVLMFIGFMHCAITYFVGRNMIKYDEIKSIILTSAFTARYVLPHHGLPETYITDTADMVKAAINATGGDLNWTKHYYEALQKTTYKTSVDIGTFCGCLARDSMALAS